MTRKLIVALLLFSRSQASSSPTIGLFYQSVPTRDTNHRLYQANGHLHLSIYVHLIMYINLQGRFMKIHFVSLRFKLVLGKNLFNDSRLVVDSEPTVALRNNY